MVKFLKALPRPTAVFAPMDGRARLVLDACQAAGLRVPEEIAVLGVDNDTLLCESTVPALSSIHTGGFRRGQIAAEMLDDLMQGREPSERVVSLPPISVITRGSTGYDAMSDPIFGHAISYIREKAARGGVPVPEVARAAGCSRSYLDKGFRAKLGMSVREAVLKMRLEFVKELLATTSRSMTEIAMDCGFARDSHLAVLFKKATGKTMLQWRRENREAPDE
jgi:LacI family transcriptional regulator